MSDQPQPEWQDGQIGQNSKLSRLQDIVNNDNPLELVVNKKPGQAGEVAPSARESYGSEHSKKMLGGGLSKFMKNPFRRPGK